MEESKKIIAAPDNTAVRVALWRALHLQLDAPPHILEDNIGFELVAPDPGWRNRPDMHPDFTKRLRASVVARSRFVEDLVGEAVEKGCRQYVILGAGLDTFAQRRPDIVSKMAIYEIDQPATQAWKQQRLTELGYSIPPGLHFVSVDFEAASWWEELLKSGFDKNKPSLVACTGVTLYLTREAILHTLRQLATIAPGSTLAIAFYLPKHLLDKQDQFLQEVSGKGAREAGTPFMSFFSPGEIRSLAIEAGLSEVQIVSSGDLSNRYFSNRKDNLHPASGEEFLIARL